MIACNLHTVDISNIGNIVSHQLSAAVHSGRYNPGHPTHLTHKGLSHIKAFCAHMSFLDNDNHRTQVYCHSLRHQTRTKTIPQKDLHQNNTGSPLYIPLLGKDLKKGGNITSNTQTGVVLENLIVADIDFKIIICLAIQPARHRPEWSLKICVPI